MKVMNILKFGSLRGIDYIPIGLNDQNIIMCRKFILASSIENIENRFNIKAPLRLDRKLGIVVSPDKETLIITQQNPKKLTLSKFGITPAWAKQPMNLINARAEGNKNPQNDPMFTGGYAIFMKPAFKRPLVRQRCIVIADAFIEWSSITKQPYLIYLRGRERPFGMAGLYDIWINPETKAEHHSFTIITVPGNSLIHQLPATRMPVILPKGRETNWLRPSNHLTDILGMLDIFPAERMNAYPISRDIDLPGPFTSDILKPIGDRLYTEIEQRFIPHRHWGHKQKGAGGGTWQGNNL
jgi:putative SOS response-associated peptidase YedK